MWRLFPWWSAWHHHPQLSFPVVQQRQVPSVQKTLIFHRFSSLILSSKLILLLWSLSNPPPVVEMWRLLLWSAPALAATFAASAPTVDVP